MQMFLMFTVEDVNQDKKELPFAFEPEENEQECRRVNVDESSNHYFQETQWVVEGLHDLWYSD